MKIKSIFVSALSLVMLIGLTGCAKYRGKTLRSLTKISSAKKDTISFSYHVFSTTDCRKFFDRNLIKKGYQPIQITFVNNTDRYFNISKESLNLDCISTKEVAKSVHTSTVGRAVGYGVVGVFIWPFIIPAIVDGIGSAKANKRLDRDFARKALSKQIVAPHSKINGVIFVSTNTCLDEEISLTVSDHLHNQFTLTTDNPILAI